MGMLDLFRSRQAKGDRWRDEFQKAAERGDARAALVAAEKLASLPAADGFVRLAGLYKELDRPEKVIEVLNRGTSAFSNESGLWEMLGMARQDQGDWVAAIAAYDKAAKLWPPQSGKRAAIAANRALALDASGQRQQALIWLDQQPEPDDAEGWLRLRGLGMSLLCQLGRFDEAKARIEAALERFKRPGSADAVHPGLIARLHVQCAAAHWRNGAGDRAAALEHVWRSVAIDPTLNVAMSFLRKLENQQSQTAAFYDVKVRFTADRPQGPGLASSICVNVYSVLADSATEAQDMAVRFVPTSARKRLVIESTERRDDPSPSEPKGVFGFHEMRLPPQR